MSALILFSLFPFVYAVYSPSYYILGRACNLAHTIWEVFQDWELILSNVTSILNYQTFIFVLSVQGGAVSLIGLYKSSAAILSTYATIDFDTENLLEKFLVPSVYRRYVFPQKLRLRGLDAVYTSSNSQIPAAAMTLDSMGLLF